MKNSKSWAGYFAYLLFFIGYSIVSYELLVSINNQIKGTFNPLPYFLCFTIVFTLFGIILRIDYILKEIKKDGHWKIDMNKIIFVGLPTLYFVICYFATSTNAVRHIVFPSISNVLRNVGYIPATIPIFFGYTIISSFYKTNTQEKTEKTLVKNFLYFLFSIGYVTVGYELLTLINKQLLKKATSYINIISSLLKTDINNSKAI